MGILNIVMGSLFLLCYLCNGINLIMQSSTLNRPGAFGPGQDPAVEMAQRMQEEIPGITVFQVTNTLAHLALSILLLICGIGLLNMRGWARVGSIIYAVVTILVDMGALFYQLAFINPVMNRMFEELARRGRMGPGGPSLAGLGTIINVVTVIVYLLLMIYAIILLIMMLLPRVRAAFASGPPPEESLAERYEEGGEEYERRRDPWNY